MEKFVCLLVSLLTIGVHYSRALSEEDVRAVAAKCNATTDDLDVTLQFRVPETLSGKCLMLCMLKVYGTINAAGEFDKENCLASFRVKWKGIPEKHLVEIADECNRQMQSHADKKNTCEYGYLSIKCINGQFISRNLLSSVPKN